MADILPFRLADRRELVMQGHFAGAINGRSRQWAGRRQRQTSRAGLVADIIDIGTRCPVRDLEAVLAELGRPMSELEVVLARFGVAILERERQQRAAEEKPE
jgi:hypothetical protein